jgi:hypothetical protein
MILLRRSALPSFVALLLGSLPTALHAGKLAGFTADGQSFHDAARKGERCTVAVADAGGVITTPTVCSVVDPATPRSKLVAPGKAARQDASGFVALGVGSDGTTVTVGGTVGETTQTLLTFEAAAEVSAVRGPFLGPGGRVVGLEVDTGKGKSKVTTAVVVDVGAGLDALRPAAGSVVARVTAQATTWVQPQVPCDQAGVTVVLGPGSAFKIATDVKCETYSDRLRVSGDFWGKEPNTLVFRFQNRGGPEERLECTVSGTGADMTLGCSAGDVAFAVKPAPPPAPAPAGKKGGPKPLTPGPDKPNPPDNPARPKPGLTR